jgi:hypothetical protein
MLGQGFTFMELTDQPDPNGIRQFTVGTGGASPWPF